jgi:hypothetical protein
MKTISAYSKSTVSNFFKTLKKYSYRFDTIPLIPFMLFVTLHSPTCVQMVSCGADKSIIFRDVNTEDSAGITLSRVNHIVGKTTLYDMELDRYHTQPSIKYPVLWNRNYLLRFRFRLRLLKSYGSGSVSRP